MDFLFCSAKPDVEKSTRFLLSQFVGIPARNPSLFHTHKYDDLEFPSLCAV